MILAFYSERRGDVTGIGYTEARAKSVLCVTNTIASRLFEKNTEDKWTIYVILYPVIFYFLLKRQS